MGEVDLAAKRAAIQTALEARAKKNTDRRGYVLPRGDPAGLGIGRTGGGGEEGVSETPDPETFDRWLDMWEVSRASAAYRALMAERDRIRSDLKLANTTLQRTNEMLDKSIATLRIKHREPCPEASVVLCDDCPPIGYPTDDTRCEECPRRQS